MLASGVVSTLEWEAARGVGSEGWERRSGRRGGFFQACRGARVVKEANLGNRGGSRRTFLGVVH